MADLVLRGPITALAGLIASATVSAGWTLWSLHNTVVDCVTKSSTAAACGTDILEVVVGSLISIGSIAGATLVGLTTPLPRDLSHHDLIFRVDNQNINWTEGMANHQFGINRTIENPAVVEFQHNATSVIHKYISYQDNNNNLVMRYPTGVMIPDEDSKRGLCDAYWDVIIWGDDLRSWELNSDPGYNGYYGLASSLYNYYLDHTVNSACVGIFGNDNYGTKVNLGASCGQTVPHPSNCGSANYNIQLYELQT